jgi:sortase A
VTGTLVRDPSGVEVEDVASVVVVEVRDEAQRSARSDLRTVLRWGVVAFVGVVAAYAVFLVSLSGFQHDRAQSSLERHFRTDLAAGLAPVGGAIPEGTAVALVQAPRIGLREVVVEGTTSGQLERGPGHVRATPLPGQKGNAAIVGRRLAYGAPFADIGSLRPGDLIRVTTGQGHSAYRVTSVGRAAGDARRVYQSRGTGELTLLTSDPALVADRWLVAHARLTTKPKQSTAHLGTVTREELGLTGESGTLPMLVLALQLVLVAAIGSVWLFRRWGRWPAYVVAAPVGVAALWLLFEQLTRVLPAAL